MCNLLSITNFCTVWNVDNFTCIRFFHFFYIVQYILTVGRTFLVRICIGRLIKLWKICQPIESRSNNCPKSNWYRHIIFIRNQNKRWTAEREKNTLGNTFYKSTIESARVIQGYYHINICRGFITLIKTYLKCWCLVFQKLNN